MRDGERRVVDLATTTKSTTSRHHHRGEAIVAAPDAIELPMIGPIGRRSLSRITETTGIAKD